jgi:hypothetical protein
MDPEKPNKNSGPPSSGPSSLGSNELRYEELSKRARDMSDSKPISVTSSREEVYAASNSLVQSTQLIVDSVLVVIKDVEEQNRQQKLNHESEKMMMNILETELHATRADNRTTRHLIWGCIVISIFAVVSMIYMIQRNSAVANQIESDFIQTNATLKVSLDAIIATQKVNKELIEKSPTISIESNGKSGSASLSVTQPITSKAGDTSIKVVKIPLSTQNIEAGK